MLCTEGDITEKNKNISVYSLGLFERNGYREKIKRNTNYEKVL